MEGYILIADDYLPIRRLIHEVLQEEGFLSHTVANGKSCLELSTSDSKPMLILLDWQMPGMTGYEVLKTLKGNRSTQEIPVIMVTGESGVKELALEAGAYDVMAKPVDFKKLLRSIRDALQEKAS